MGSRGVWLTDISNRMTSAPSLLQFDRRQKGRRQ